MEATVAVLYQASQLMLVAAVALILLRLIGGPSLVDRAVAIDMIALAIVGLLLVESNATAGRLYTDAALGLALFSVVGTVFLAYFLGRGEFPDE